MAVAALGGGSSAVGASSHANCARFRGTDPLITKRTRRRLAQDLRFPDAGGTIPEARWMRAMTLEKLVRDKKFASKVATTTVGQLSLERPTSVVIANAKEKPAKTESLLVKAHERAVADGAATVIHQLAVPFVGFEGAQTTDVKPDFVVVAPKTADEGAGSWLIVGDVKDYERIRSRIEDTRLLKGFLQVAVGAESFDAWTRLPDGMDVHQFGVLAVPRNAFLQPEPVVEDLTDYRTEIAMRIAERKAEADLFDYDEATPIDDFVEHLTATFDPVSCTSCTLFRYCRAELQRSANPVDLLIELGVPPETRPLLAGMVDGSGEIGNAPASMRAMVAATLTGHGVSTGQKRIDPVGLPGTVNVVIAKSDAAALGVHGMAVQRVTRSGASDWDFHTFDLPQSSTTRRDVMKVLGKEIAAAMAELRKANPDHTDPVHIVVPDRTTADVLASIADNLAGVELSRIRWERDREIRRPALTYDGEKADIPPKLPEVPRTAVSFFLEEDRARAMTLRAPVVDLRATLARHVVAGGPAAASGRLDYLVAWADAPRKLDHRALAEDIENLPHTPGARLTSETSNQIHTALTGNDRKVPKPNLSKYRSLVLEELTYKTSVFDRAVKVLSSVPASNMRRGYRVIEANAQDVWRRRLRLHASDLVRFGRTYAHWRNMQVPAIDADKVCGAQLQALANPQAASDMAMAAGNRQLALATVVETAPDVVLKVESRRIGDGSRIVLLHANDEPCVDAAHVDVNTEQKGAVKVDGLSIGPLEAVDLDEPTRRFEFVWRPKRPATLSVGDQVVVADFSWFAGDQKGIRYLPVKKPAVDDQSAPKDSCASTSYAENPDAHQFCCKSHEQSEADFSDQLAERRARGELNPQTWPPVRDADAFEVSATNAPGADPFDLPSQAPPDDLTIDDLE
jgi:hypothetical protein